MNTSDLNNNYFKAMTIPHLLEDELDERFSAYPPKGMEVLGKLQKIQEIAKLGLSPRGRGRSRVQGQAVLRARVAKLSSKLTPYRDAHLQECFRIYEKAQEVMFLILGTKEIRESDELLKNFGKLTHEEQISQGQILATDHWSLLLNDVMILGAYMSGVPLQVSSQTVYPSTADLHTGDEERILARELKMAKALGYIKGTSKAHETTLGISLRLPAEKDLTYAGPLSQEERKEAFEKGLACVRTVAAVKLGENDVQHLLGGGTHSHESGSIDNINKFFNVAVKYTLILCLCIITLT
ncbi:MAG: hypothetical protein KBC64_05470 [Simkaniaceae bacterium]|nr:hypothetical protein [Simkaniaceae bacterium]